MVNYQEIRNKMYSVQLKRWKELINFKSPYTLIKAIYYMETASLFLFLTQKVIKSPNFITLLYILCGVIGAFFIALSSHDFFFYLGLFMVFTKGTFDWADGPLARRLNKTSFLGHALDCYGAHLNDLAFRVAFLYYSLLNFSEWMFLFPVLTFVLLATNLRLYTDFQYTKIIIDPEKKIYKNNSVSKNKKQTKGIQVSNFKKWFVRYTSFLDGRARSIDLILLLILINEKIYYDLSIFLLIISILIVLRCIMLHIASAYSTFKFYNKV
jgi:hypothetical protein|tara:strand:+ start:10219 stop:11022 length:804 start_codon:yes stop_codon:yes gene_type:complete